MQITGMKYGAPVLKLPGFPVPEILNANATLDEIDQIIKKKCKSVIKPVFYGGVGKTGKVGQVKIVSSSAEIADHLDRGQDMDYRTPVSETIFVV